MLQLSCIKLLICTVLYFSSFLMLHAQETNSIQPDTTKKLKWEVATDLLWLIDKNTLPKYTVFGRYHYKTKSGKDRAIRVRIGGDYFHDVPYFPAIANNSTKVPFQEKIKFVGRVGYEWRKKYEKITLIYGLDASIDLNREFENVYGSGVQGDFEGSDGNRILTYQFITFVGFQYHLSSQISLSLETSFNFGYADSKSLYIRRLVNNPNSIGYGANRATFISNFNPFQVINLSYHF